MGARSASVLEMAMQFAALGIVPRRTTQFVWWGAEEVGLLGSRHYVRTLTPEEAGNISATLNFDMLGSPNYARMVYDGNGCPPQSIVSCKVLQGMFEVRTLPLVHSSHVMHSPLSRCLTWVITRTRPYSAPSYTHTHTHTTHTTHYTHTHTHTHTHTPKPSQATHELIAMYRNACSKAFFKSKGLEYQLEPFSTVGGSDYFPFLALGVPAGSIATGAGSIKNSAMRDKYVCAVHSLYSSDNV
jgi:hypothetical protein